MVTGITIKCFMNFSVASVDRCRKNKIPGWMDEIAGTNRILLGCFGFSAFN